MIYRSEPLSPYIAGAVVGIACWAIHWLFKRAAAYFRASSEDGTTNVK